MRLFYSTAMLVAALMATGNAHAAGSLLRIACEGDDAGAEVQIDGKFKGECPLDLQIQAGTVRLLAVKKAGPGRERRFEQEFRIGDGVIKRLELQLGEAQFTAEGQRLENARLTREHEEQQRAATERRRLEALAEAEARARLDKLDAEARERIDKRVDELLAEDGAQRSGNDTAITECPHCPKIIAPPGGRPTRVVLPQTSDAETNGWIKQIEPELNQYLDNQAAFLKLPTAIVPWPCDSAAGAMRALTGFASLSEAPTEQQQSYKRQVGAAATYYFRDVRFWLVQMSCKDGRLDGEVDVWAFGIMVSDNPNHLMITPTLKRLRFTAAGGKVADLLRSMNMTGTGITEYKDAATNAMMKKNGSIKLERVAFGISRPGLKENPRAVTVINATFEDKQYQDTIDGPTTVVVLPLGPGRTESLSFVGLRKATRSLLKDGKMHGETTMFASRIRTGAFIPDVKIPESQQCWKEGVLITANPCNVD